MTLETSKNLGGIGAILMFLGIIIGFVPFVSMVSSIIELIGLILVLVGLHGLGSYYKDSGIFNNALYGVIVAIIGAVVVAVIAFAIILTTISPLLYQIYPGWDGNWASLAGLTPDTSAITAGSFDLSTLLPALFGAIAIIIIVWIVTIVATFLIRRSLKSASAKSNVGLFGTAGLIMLIGAFLAIIFIGFILIWISALLLAVAFFQVKQSESTTSTNVPYPPPPTSA